VLGEATLHSLQKRNGSAPAQADPLVGHFHRWIGSQHGKQTKNGRQVRSETGVYEMDLAEKFVTVQEDTAMELVKQDSLCCSARRKSAKLSTVLVPRDYLQPNKISGRWIRWYDRP
jgi:hypothetical protein